MANLADARLNDLEVRVITTINDEVVEDSYMDENDAFAVDFIRAIRKGKSPVNALTFLADTGSYHVRDAEHITAAKNRIGLE